MNTLLLAATLALSANADAVTFKNTGTGSQTVTSVSAPAAPFTITSNGCTGTTIAPSGTCNIAVTATPTAAGSFSSSITVFTNKGKSYTLPLTVATPQFEPFTLTTTIAGGGSWTVPAGTTSAIFSISGGGGGGGGSDWGGSCNWLFGYGGSASNRVAVAVAVTPGQVYTYTAGAGGAATVAWKKYYPAPTYGGTSYIYRGATLIHSVAGAYGGVSRVTGAAPSGGFPGQVSTNGGANGGHGSYSGCKWNGDPGSAAGVANVTYSGVRQLW